MRINDNYLKVKDTYLFSTLAKKEREYREANPSKQVIKMGIGDVTLPLSKTVTNAMVKASEEMSTAGGFHGYGPEQGYDFLRNAIVKHYAKRGVILADNEVFVGDGAKSDIANILDIFSEDNTVLISDPVYPVYFDTNIMAGRNVRFMKADESNNFAPLPDGKPADIIYLCSPCNPTGAVYTVDELKQWIDFANETGAVILFDAAYEAFIKDPSLPKSIYEIEGSKTCAIEFCSLSKTAGFTGVRCGYTVVPMQLIRNNTKLNSLWLRRQTTKYNGVSYIVQRGAEAVFTNDGQEDVKLMIDFYLENAKIIAQAFDSLNISYIGGKNSPYIWFKCPKNMKSWECFDYILENASLIVTPGAGFGECGEGFMRLTAFNTRANTIEAAKRLTNLFSE